MATAAPPTYPTWIRGRRIATFWILALTLVVPAVVVGMYWWPAFLALLIGAPVVYVAVVISLTSWRLGPRGDGVQSTVHQLVVEAVGDQGPALDIGCGSGELLIRLARAGRARGVMVGLDYWGDDWAYSQQQAQANAVAAGVPWLRFVRGTASRLPFADGTYGRVVSALTFHEVRDVDDKTRCVAEAVRVLAPGGRFALVDLFDAPSIYGSRDRVLAAISEAGGEVTSTRKLSEVVDLRWPLTLRQGLKYAVLVTGTRTASLA